jgi:two-component system, chemotaxis family, protein-glutamate methylesterase/glutaminase
MSERRRPRRVVICDDSKAYATALTRFLDSDEEMEVVGVAASGEQAICEVQRLKPDLLTLDMQIPGIDGLGVVKALMASHPLPIVILSAHAPKGSQRAVEALAAGALDVVSKDSVRLDQLDDVWARAMRSRLRRFASVRLAHPVSNGAVASARAVSTPAHVARVVGVGASTGGPPAIAAMLGKLTSDFQLPVLVVQHIAAGFVDGLARWLAQKLSVAARVAEEGQLAGPGVWLAPDGAHLTLSASMRFGFDRESKGAHRPSVDVMLSSLADGFGEHAVGVVLTGMGTDGAKGAGAIRQAGGLVIAQDQASSVVYGMPRAVAEHGADLSLSPVEIGEAVNAMRPPRGGT